MKHPLASHLSLRSLATAMATLLGQALADGLDRAPILPKTHAAPAPLLAPGRALYRPPAGAFIPLDAPASSPRSDPARRDRRNRRPAHEFHRITIGQHVHPAGHPPSALRVPSRLNSARHNELGQPLLAPARDV